MAKQDPPGGTSRFRRSPDASGDQGARTSAAGAGGENSGTPSRVPWVALGIAAVLTLWQVIYSITLHTVDPASQDVYTSVSLFVSLILAVGAAVTGTVALSQRHRPRWPAIAAVAIGAYVFVVCVASWIGGLMATPV